MKVTYELTKSDYTELAKEVIKKQSNKAFMDSVHKLSEEAARNLFWTVFEKNQVDFEMAELVEKHLHSSIEKAILKGNLLESKISKVLDSKDMKELTAKMLRNKAAELEAEAEALEYPD